MEKEIINLIEKNPIALATSTKNCKPHVIGVAYVKVKEDKIIITNNYMKTTIENIKMNPQVSLVVWDKSWKGCIIDGVAEYHETGSWKDFVKSIEKNKNEPCKGAIVIRINNIKKVG